MTRVEYIFVYLALYASEKILVVHEHLAVKHFGDLYKDILNINTHPWPGEFRRVGQKNQPPTVVHQSILMVGLFPLLVRKERDLLMLNPNLKSAIWTLSRIEGLFAGDPPFIDDTFQRVLDLARLANSSPDHVESTNERPVLSSEAGQRVEVRLPDSTVCTHDSG